MERQRMSNAAFCRGRREIPLCQQTPVREVFQAGEFSRHLNSTGFGPCDNLVHTKH